MIRPASKADAGALVDLLAAQMKDHAIECSRADLAKCVRAALENGERGAFLVAELDHKIVGVAYVAFLFSMEHAGSVSMLEELYVLPEHRGAGLGTELLRSAIDWHCLKPSRPMELEIDDSHRALAEFYRKEGFELRSRTRWIRKP